MIRPEELRIGNYFLTDERELAILTGMSPLGHLVRCDTEDGCELLHDIVKYDGSIDKGWEVESKYCEPIPITEEILLRCGFENQMSWTYRINLTGDKYFVYYLGEKGWSIGNKNYSDFECKYLHQLQNIYWCLCGKELVFNA